MTALMPLILAGCLILLAGWPTPAPAITITDGEMLATGVFGSGPLHLVGDDFELTGGFTRIGHYVRCDACLPGEVIHAQGFWCCQDLGGGVTWRGHEYGGISAPSSPVHVEVGFFATAIAPPVGPDPLAVLTVPFTLAGRWSGTDVDDQPFSESLVGTGLATITLRQWTFHDGSARWLTQSVLYDVTPVPEPATLLLVGTGVAWVAWRRYSVRAA